VKEFCFEKQTSCLIPERCFEKRFEKQTGKSFALKNSFEKQKSRSSALKNKNPGECFETIL